MSEMEYIDDIKMMLDMAEDELIPTIEFKENFLVGLYENAKEEIKNAKHEWQGDFWNGYMTAINDILDTCRGYRLR